MANHTIRVGANGGCNPDTQRIKLKTDTVEWQSESDQPCTVVFRGGGPFTKSNYNVPPRGKSEQARQRDNVGEGNYQYDVNVPGGPSADPAIDIRA